MIMIVYFLCVVVISFLVFKYIIDPVDHHLKGMQQDNEHMRLLLEAWKKENEEEKANDQYDK